MAQSVRFVASAYLYPLSESFIHQLLASCSAKYNVRSPGPAARYVWQDIPLQSPYQLLIMRIPLGPISYGHSLFFRISKNSFIRSTLSPPFP